MTQGYEGIEDWGTHPSFGAASSPTYSPPFLVPIQSRLIFVFGTLRQTLPLTLCLMSMLACLSELDALSPTLHQTSRNLCSFHQFCSYIRMCGASHSRARD